MYSIRFTNQFKKDFKVIQKGGYDIERLKKVIDLLAKGDVLPKLYKDHAFVCDWHGYRDLHIRPDWILIYRIVTDSKTVELVRTGSHSDLFDK